MNRPIFSVSLAFAIVLVPAVAQASWPEGHVVEGDSAYTVPAGHGRISLLGRSSVGLGERVELSTYLPLDVLLFPNLGLKWRLLQSDTVALALKGGVGGGLYPVAAGVTVPIGAAVGGAGLVGAAYQNVDLTLSVTPAQPVTLSLRAGIMRLEYGLTAVIGAAGGGGGGAAGVSSSGHMNVPNGGFELDALLSTKNALIAEAEAYRLHDNTTLIAPYLAWYHAFGEHFHLVVGGFTFAELPATNARRFLPLPYANVYWNF